MKIGLGTVQFGLDYGIANAAGRVPPEEVARILALAAQRGIEVIDTAAAYGEAEMVLGRQLPSDHRFRVVTKLPKVPDGVATEDVDHWASNTFASSLAKLRCSAVDTLMLHDAGDLLGPHADVLFALLGDLRSRRHLKRIGASVYDGAQIDALLARGGIDVVQLPINLLDRRLIAGGQLDRLKAAGVEIHARSLLLQGLLTMDPATLPAHFDAARPQLQRLHGEAAARGLSPAAAAIGFAVALPQIDHAIVGVTSAVELAELLDAAAQAPEAGWYAGYGCDALPILNPALWPPRQRER